MMRTLINKDDDDFTLKAKYYLCLIQNLLEQFKEENNNKLKSTKKAVQK